MIGQSSKQSFTGGILEGRMLVASVLLLERFLVEKKTSRCVSFDVGILRCESLR